MKGKYPSNPVLLVDDEELALESYASALKTSGINNILTSGDSREVIPLLADRRIEVVVLDILMPHKSGTNLLGQITADFPDIPVIMLTGVDELYTAVECMRLGAFDYMLKPLEKSRFVSGVKRALEMTELRRENISLRHNLFTGQLDNPEVFSAIITQNAGMRSIFQYIETIAKTGQPILITGETGTGKELIASAVYKASDRTGQYVTINTAGLDDAMLSDTLFGHTKGSFTGADSRRSGLIAQASGGTLFLDEIGDLSAASQVKLLRLLQNGEYYPIGSDKAFYSDAQVIAATNRELQPLIEADRFRKDLYYRLSGHMIHVPALRERADDISPLVNHFINKVSTLLGKKSPTPPRELYTLLGSYHFPGNIRELENMVFDAVSRHNHGKLPMKSFREAIDRKQKQLDKNQRTTHNGEMKTDAPLELGIRQNSIEGFPTLKEAENYLVSKAMELSGDNQTIAAQLLGITRLTLNKRLSRAKKRQG